MDDCWVESNAVHKDIKPFCKLQSLSYHRDSVDARRTSFSNMIKRFPTVYESEVAIQKKWCKGLAIEIVFNTD